MAGLTDTQKLISDVCDEIKGMLIEKNRKYGDSALNPVRIFSKSDALEQLNVRIDDKLNRKKNQQDDEDEDVDMDLLGYLVLKMCAIRLSQKLATGGVIKNGPIIGLETHTCPGFPPALPSDFYKTMGF